MKKKVLHGAAQVYRIPEKVKITRPLDDCTPHCHFEPCMHHVVWPVMSVYQSHFLSFVHRDVSLVTFCAGKTRRDVKKTRAYTEIMITSLRRVICKFFECSPNNPKGFITVNPQKMRSIALMK